MINYLHSQDPRITIGKYTYGNPQFMLWEEQESIFIGSFCSIADQVVILGGGEHRNDWITTYPLHLALGCQIENCGHPSTKGPTIIGNDVWIGCRATILSGVTIGDGAIVAAGAVVSKDIPPYTISGGVPNKTIRRRFSREQIDILMKIKWWNWPEQKIKEVIPLLLSSNIDRFIIQHHNK